MENKKFLFISKDAPINDVAWHVLNEGNEVKYFIEDRTQKEVADGLVPKTNNWKKHIAWADVIVFDNIGFGAAAKKLREKGRHVVGGTQLCRNHLESPI